MFDEKQNDPQKTLSYHSEITNDSYFAVSRTITTSEIETVLWDTRMEKVGIFTADLGKMDLTIKVYGRPKGKEPYVRLSKRSLLVCNTHCKNSMETSHNSVKVKFGIKVIKQRPFHFSHGNFDAILKMLANFSASIFISKSHHCTLIGHEIFHKYCMISFIHVHVREIDEQNGVGSMSGVR